MSCTSALTKSIWITNFCNIVWIKIKHKKKQLNIHFLKKIEFKQLSKKLKKLKQKALSNILNNIV